MPHKFRIVIAIIGLSSLLNGNIAIAKKGAGAPERPPVAAPRAAMVRQSTNQIIVKLKPGAQASHGRGGGAALVGALSDSSGLKLDFHREMHGGYMVIKLPSAMGAAEFSPIFAKLMANSDVEFVEPDTFGFGALIPDDLNYETSQWDMGSPVSPSIGINLPAAWDITTGDPNLVIADIDSGYRPHVDLVGRLITPTYDFVSDPQIANDGDGRDSDARDPGDWVTVAETNGDFFNGCGFQNSTWHGTHVAGTLGATSNNGMGVTGVNWKSKILAVRVYGKCGNFWSDMVDGMRWAAGLTVTGVPDNPNPARVINLSLQGGGACNLLWQNAINEVVAKGVVVVAAAGNYNAESSNTQPGSCNGGITVAATTKTGNKAQYSNYGAQIEISAPGGDYRADGNGILSTFNSGITAPGVDIYADNQGTSMASPHVAGVVSLMLSVNPNLTPTQVLQILQQTVTAFPAGSTCNTNICGAGIVNAAAAVLAAKQALGISVTVTAVPSTTTPISTATATAVPPTPTSTATATAVPPTPISTATDGASTQTLANTNPISIPVLGNAFSRAFVQPYGNRLTLGSTINVSGMSGNVSKVVVRLAGITHPFPDDLDILLVSPRGTSVLLMSDTGGANALNGVTLTFDDAATASLSDSGRITTGAFKPTNYDTNTDIFMFPRPSFGPFGSKMSLFNGKSPNGKWTLYVRDDAISSFKPASIGSWEMTVITQ